MRFSVSLFLLLLPFAAQAKPSYSFGDNFRQCEKNSDCAIIIVSCHKCDWADSVSQSKLKEAEKIVKDYCAKWSRQEKREPDCTKTLPVKKREAVCQKGICEGRTFFIHPK